MSACYTRYDRVFNVLYLRDDASTSWLGPLSMGAGTTIENSQCILNAATSSAVASGTNLTVNVALSFKGAFGGAKTTYMRTQDGGAFVPLEQVIAAQGELGSFRTFQREPAQPVGLATNFDE